MKRREALLALMAIGLQPLAASAQQGAKQFRIGWLSNNTPESSKHLENAFKQGLRELGYSEGQNTTFEFRWAMGKAENWPRLAQELVSLKLDVILAGTTFTAAALLKETSTVPVVGTLILDPVGNGLAKSLAHPGGNFTGRASLGEDTSIKLLELLRTAMPRISRVGAIWNAANPALAAIVNSLKGSARGLGITLLPIAAKNLGEIESGFARLAEEKVRGVIAFQDALVLMHKRQIADLALRYRMASVFGTRDVAEVGGLISYGVSFKDEYRRAASYVDKILKGAKPADLPIEQAMTFDLVVNQKTAKALGIKIPQSLLLSANEVIE